MGDFYPVRRWLSMGGVGVLVALTAVACTAAKQASPPSPGPTTASATPTPTGTTAAGVPAACGSVKLPDATVSPLPPGAVSGTATVGSRTVTITGKPAAYSIGVGLTSAGISITDHGSVVLSGRLDPPTDTVRDGAFSLGAIGVTPTAGATTATVTGGPVCAAQFAGQAAPTALVAFFTGGAHCCTIVRAYPATTAGVGPPIDINLGDPGGVLQLAGDHAIVLTKDDAFAYQFDSFAGSGLPVKVLDLRNGAFVDVTREHLDLVGADAANWAALMLGDANNPPNQPGIVAAWVADQCLLGHGTEAFATLDTLNAQGKLHSSQQIAGPDTSGTAYEAALRVFLKKGGYCP